MSMDVYIAILAFLLFLGFTYIFNLLKVFPPKGKKKGKKKNSTKKDFRIVEIEYLSMKFNLKKEKLYRKGILFTISFIDSLIVAGTFLVIVLIPVHWVIQLIIGFVLLFGLIFSIYGIYGQILVKKGYEKDE